MLKKAGLIILVLLLSGCASTAGTFFNRPVVEDSVADVVHTVSLSADRRTVIVAKDPRSPVRYCAEPPPDTATGLKTDLDMLAKVKGDELSVKDRFDTSVTVLSARNAPLDAFRTGMYALCQFYMNGALGDKDVRPMFEQLLTTFVETQKAIPAITAGSAKPTTEGTAAPTPATTPK